MHIVVDVETTGPTPNHGQLRAIGAVAIADSRVFQSLGEFYLTVETDPDGPNDPDTMKWWEEQSPLVRKLATNDPVSRDTAAREFLEFCAQFGDDIQFWAGPAAYDAQWIQDLYQTAQPHVQWLWEGVRPLSGGWRWGCVRTLASLHPHAAKMAPDIAHYALDDARAEAAHLFDLLRAQEGGRWATYEQGAALTDCYEEPRLLQLAVGLGGEVGEASNKIKKVYRDHGGELTDEARAGINLELGDTLWYVARLAAEIGMSLDDVVRANRAKLLDRDERGVIGGEGDYR